MSDIKPVFTFGDHIEAITSEYPSQEVVYIESDESQIAIVDFECAGKRWVSLICEDSAGEVSQMNIVGNKAIAALASVLNK